MVHHVGDGPVHLLPQIQRHALPALLAAVHLVVKAGHRGDAPLHGPENHPYGVVVGGPCQMVAALSAPDALDVAAAHQDGNHLLQILLTDPLHGGHRLHRKILLLVEGQRQHQMQRIPAFGRNSHGCSPRNSYYSVGIASVKRVFHFFLSFPWQLAISLILKGAQGQLREDLRGGKPPFEGGLSSAAHRRRSRRRGGRAIRRLRQTYNGHASSPVL